MSSGVTGDDAALADMIGAFRKTGRQFGGEVSKALGEATLILAAVQSPVDTGFLRSKWSVRAATPTVVSLFDDCDYAQYQKPFLPQSSLTEWNQTLSGVTEEVLTRLLPK